MKTFEQAQARTEKLAAKIRKHIAAGTPIPYEWFRKHRIAIDAIWDVHFADRYWFTGWDNRDGTVTVSLVYHGETDDSNTAWGNPASGSGYEYPQAPIATAPKETVEAWDKELRSWVNQRRNSDSKIIIPL